MHEHLEIIMPPRDLEDIQDAVQQVMDRYCTTEDDSESEYRFWAFWDFYLLGGRYSGRKLTNTLDQERIEAFFKALQDADIQVHVVVAGKQSVTTPEQWAQVNAIWNERFPDSGFDECPYFENAGPVLMGDVMELGKIRVDKVECNMMIVADEEGAVVFRAQDSVFNGTNHETTTWNGTIQNGLELMAEMLEHYTPEYRYRVTPKDDWLVVTVDFHS